MSRLRTKILERAREHDQILQQIGELDGIPAALSQQSNLLRDIEHQLQKSVKELDNLTNKVEEKRLIQENSETSKGKWLAHKLTRQKDKFAAKESKEEE
jgi:hypothetical protein